MKFLTTGQRKLICERYEKGELIKTIAWDFKIDQSTVFRVARSAGLFRRAKRTWVYKPRLQPARKQADKPMSSAERAWAYRYRLLANRYVGAWLETRAGREIRRAQ